MQSEKKLHIAVLEVIFCCILCVYGTLAVLQSVGYKSFSPSAGITLSYTIEKNICKYIVHI